jgi:hypothetical protein
MAKRIIPNLYVTLESEEDYNLLSNNEHVIDIILGSGVLGIKDANKLQKKEAIIVELNSSGNYVSLPREKWQQSLEKAQQYYIESEDYEVCADIQKLIESINSYGPKRSSRKTSRTDRFNNRDKKYIKTS